MNTKKLTSIGLLALLAGAFFFGVTTYQKSVQTAQDEQARAEQSRLVRMHSPVFGPANAPVTIVEFFDPACETCRAFYPIVKDLLAQYPTEVRLVIRYAPLHKGLDVVVKLLAASKRQGKYQAVLEAGLETQPAWADHAQPNVMLAFQAAAQTGLNVTQAIEDAQKPEMDALLQQDIADLTALKVSKTPTFFVNGRSLRSFGPDQLAALVAEEVAKVRK